MKTQRTLKLKRILQLLLILFLSSTNATFSQVGINTTMPANGSILDIESTDKGIFIPRVAITDLSTIAPITGITTAAEELAAAGLLVYNTDATTGEGLYAWNGTDFVPIGSGGTPVIDDWKLAGNAGTTPGTDFIGTSDDVSLYLSTNSLERMRIENNGQVSVNGAPNFAFDRFTSNGALDDDVINGYSSGIGTGVYGFNNANGSGVVGFNSDIGVGVFGVGTGNDAFQGFSQLGAPTFRGIDGPVVAINTAFDGDALVGIGSGDNFNGLFAGNMSVASTGGITVSGPQLVTIAAGTGLAASGQEIGVFGYAGQGDAIAANNGNSAGLFFLDTDDDLVLRATSSLAGFADADPDGTGPGGAVASADSYYGGYFSGGLIDGTESYAYAGMRHNTNAGGTAGTDFKIIGTGTNSTLIKDENNTPRIMFSPEAPEILFQDFGIGKLVNGSVSITIDPILQNAIFVDENHPLKVFITLEGNCNGVYVSNKSAQGFTVNELNNGTSNVPFSWQIVANRADTKDANGNIVSSHIDQRLPVGPGALKTKEMKQHNTKVFSEEISEGRNRRTTPATSDRLRKMKQN